MITIKQRYLVENSIVSKTVFELQSLWRVQLSITVCIVFALSSVTAGAVEKSQDELYLPCPSFTIGNIWSYRTKSPYFSETLNVMVLSKDEGMIVVGEKKTTKPERMHPKMPSPPVSSSYEEKRYEVKGRTIVRNEVKSNSDRYFSDPPEPFCGVLPPKAKFTAKSVVNGQTILTPTILTITALGEEKISVPGGTFETTIVEFRQQTAIGAGQQEGLAGSHNTVVVVYSAENVGIVKTILKVTSTMPVSMMGYDPEEEKRLRKGVDKLQKGEDFNEVMAKMQSLTPQGAPTQELKNQTFGFEAVTELQSYQVAP
ncbi:hypothetical protein FCL47_12990 [Desulfopila sp. IMCC35006]|uniref:hypothetical protein n=1 Tax=Desulfopila sp. IMCC35006 TaxID=2569542 RepID=UPI0010ACBB70|nr:hypothetical protein [Desulfopila sp. IMCC35006]TKB25456.1 hypothetical protein FCL47_12990 [Desulfopila sp. IMCC35006]